MSTKEINQIGDLPEDLALLLQINEAENPEVLERLRSLIEQGKTADEIAILCDEMGRLKYLDENDPNALINRMEFRDIKDGRIPDSLIGELTGGHVGIETVFDREYYFPSVDAIRRTRALVRLKVEEGKTPKLETHEDYIEYFESFHPSVLEEILRNLINIQLTDGCSGPCRKICIGRVEGNPKSHIPFSVIEWLFENYGGCLREEVLATPYGDSDLRDYKSEGKTGGDVIALYEKHELYHPYISTVFPRREDSIDFIYDLAINRKIMIGRLSRLVTGREEKDIEWLLEKLKKRAESEGKELDRFIENSLRRAFIFGRKQGINLIMGNAVREDTKEAEISTDVVNCSNGITLKAGEGFIGQIIRPNSKEFRHGAIQYPIRPDQDEILIPKAFIIPRAVSRYSLSQKIALRPRFKRMNRENGEVIEGDELTNIERSILETTKVKKLLLDERSKTLHEVEVEGYVSWIDWLIKSVDIETAATWQLIFMLAHLSGLARSTRTFAEEIEGKVGELLRENIDDEFATIDILFVAEQIFAYLRQVNEKIKKAYISLLTLRNEKHGQGIKRMEENTGVRVEDLLVEILLATNSIDEVLEFEIKSYSMSGIEGREREVKTTHAKLVQDLATRTGKQIKGILHLLG